MKKIIFAALCFLSFSLTAAAYNTYAPNSWDTVKKEAWDYQAAYDLCEKGRAPDYDRNFFDRGSLTRYELASVLKNILEAEKKGAAFTEEEKKKLIRLKKEEELRNLYPPIEDNILVINAPNEEKVLVSKSEQNTDWSSKTG